ncbi:MAG: CoA transferase [Flammeovirgaceae bacterium TMED32]|nr:MAG: CoA transferase [Flammeovirgaceae bacterium TMED32]
MTGSLRGLKVLDFSTLLPGPMATLFLAEAGAEVIKIERTGTGEDMRYYPPTWGESSVNFSLLNRGKKSVTVDLKNKSERDKLIPLIEKADIVVEQFRPGVMARLELDYESIKQINAKIIYCSISGFGQDGPKKHLAGHDINYIGDAGLLSLSMGSPDNPTVPPALIADIAGGSYPAVINILLALRERDLTGKGCYIDIAMTDGVLPFLFWALGKASAFGVNPENGNDRLTGGSPRYQLYPTCDQRYVAAGPLEDKFWSAFVVAIGLSEKYWDDAIDAQETIRQVALIIKGQSAAYWESILEEANCCCSIVKSVGEALSDKQFKDRGVFDNTLVSQSGDEMLAVPIPIAQTLKMQEASQKAAPLLGEHNDDFLK